MQAPYRNPRLEPCASDATNIQTHSSATQARVVPEIGKIGFMGSMYAGAGIALIQFSSVEHLGAILFFVASSGLTLLGGHSLGMHRLFIHRAWQAPRWLANLLLFLGTQVGLGGPIRLMNTHDLRDWAQRQSECHDYFSHRRPLLVDFWWQIFCRIDLANPPTLALEDDYQRWGFVHWLERTALIQHILIGHRALAHWLLCP